MSREPTYQAARVVAATIEAHFARHLVEARRRGEEKLAHAPDARAIETIIDASFWASFRPEEGRFPKISLAFLSPEQAGQPLMLEDRLPLTPAVLTKLAPAVERPGIHLGVWADENELYVWGATRTIPSLGFVLEDVEPGQLVIKHRRIDGFGKFANVAVLKGEEVKIVDEQGASLPDCPDSESDWQSSVRSSVESIAGLTAVDGATVITDQYQVLAFGVKIMRAVGSASVGQRVLTQPIVGDQAAVVPPVQHGGTRHLSAAQFIHDQRDALALVASQDGRFTIFAWSPCEQMVHAHRVDVLLL